MTPPEVLSGPEEPSLAQRLREWVTRHRAATFAGVAIVVVLGLAASTALLVARLTATPDLRVTDAAAVDDIAVRPDPEDGGAPGALGSPAGADLPGAVVVLYLDNPGPVTAVPEVRDVTGPGVRVTSLPPAAPGAGAGGAIPPGGSGSVRVAVSPVDCAEAPPPDRLGAALTGLVLARGDDGSGPEEAVVAPATLDTLLGVWREACALLPAPSVSAATVAAGQGPGSGPSTTTLALDLARTLPLDVDLMGLVVTPLDGDGRRGLGSVTRVGPGPVDVFWTTDGPSGLPPRVQVFAVRGTTALPFLLDVPTA